MLIDTHAHITHDRFANDLPQVLENARVNSVEMIISIGDTLASSKAALEQARSNRNIRATVGIHPHHANEWSEAAEAELRSLVIAPNPPAPFPEGKGEIVAIGEIGLDYHYDLAPKEVQHEAFRRQLRLAKEVSLPVVIHCRESATDIVRFLEEEQDGRLRGVVHCFTEDEATARRVIDLGLYLGFGGMVTFKHTENLRQTLRAIGLERVILETDSPYLAPIPHRGKRNEPAFVRHTAEKVAEVLAITLAEVGEITSRNARSLFAL